MEPYHRCIKPDVLPTQAMCLPTGGLRQAVPTERDLALACHDEHHRLVGGYEMVCAHAALLRQHLLSLAPGNWQEDPGWTEAIELLGGADLVTRFAAASTDDEQIAVCKLP